MLKIEDWDEYRCRYYEEVLSVLDPDEVLQNLTAADRGHDIILLRFGKDRSHCHRGLVTAWFFQDPGDQGPRAEGRVNNAAAGLTLRGIIACTPSAWNYLPRKEK